MTHKVWTAAELDEMSPAEVDDLFRKSLVTKIDEMPPGFVMRVRNDLATKTL